ncbi:hypothetical protein [Bradyrhizobium sp. USDA 336]|uniref:hypothetical protein n=1 Tax=Bradyrhizobium sp. USDA 336 TaxID=3156311 RepID=UPI003838B7D0
MERIANPPAVLLGEIDLLRFNHAGDSCLVLELLKQSLEEEEDLTAQWTAFRDKLESRADRNFVLSSIVAALFYRHYDHLLDQIHERERLLDRAARGETEEITLGGEAAFTFVGYANKAFELVDCVDFGETFADRLALAKSRLHKARAQATKEIRWTLILRGTYVRPDLHPRNRRVFVIEDPEEYFREGDIKRGDFFIRFGGKKDSLAVEIDFDVLHRCRIAAVQIYPPAKYNARLNPLVHFSRFMPASTLIDEDVHGKELMLK